MPPYSIKRQYKVRDISSPVFGPDNSVYIISDISGSRSLWKLDEPMAWPRQLTFTDGDVLWYDWSPTGDEIAFGMDQDGSDRPQLFSLDHKDRSVTKITDEPTVAHRWGGWSTDGTKFAYSANRRRNDVFDVYIDEKNDFSGDPELVFKYDGQSVLVPIGWGPDDTRLLVLERHSSFNMDIHLVDVEDRSQSRLTGGPEKQVRYKSVTWGPDGTSLYLITDYDSNWLHVARLDLESRDIMPVITSESNIQRMVLHPREKRIAYIEFENGYSEIGIGELTGQSSVTELAQVDFPTGTVYSLAMSRDASKLVTVFCRPGKKGDVYVVDTETGDRTRWTDTSSPIPEEEYISPQFHHYESFDGLEIPSFYAEPDTVVGSSTPAMIHLHGGPRSQVYPAIDPHRQCFLERGFARLEPNYRGSAGYGKEFMSLDDVEKRPDSLRDVKAGVEWLANRPAVDADRIALHGGSYGGFMVLAAMTRWPEKFTAGIAVSPIVDFEAYLKNTSQWRRELREAEYGSLEDHGALLKTLSPIQQTEQLASPILIIHGENDTRIPVEQVKRFAERANEQGGSVELHVLEDTGHKFQQRETRIEVCRRSIEFIDNYV